MDIFVLAAQQIIKAQVAVIGPIALEQAKTISGLKVINADQVEISGNPQQALEALVKRYANFFGQASIEVCKDVIREIKPPIPATDLPDILK